MSGGELNRLVTVQARQAEVDIYGNDAAETWADVIASEPAAIRPLRGGESVIAAKLQSTGLVEIKVRYSERTSQISEAHRLVNTRTPAEVYNIRYIEQPDQRGRYLVLTCERGVAHG
jgi:head-tail adaptor